MNKELSQYEINIIRNAVRNTLDNGGDMLYVALPGTVQPMAEGVYVMKDTKKARDKFSGAQGFYGHAYTVPVRKWDYVSICKMVARGLRIPVEQIVVE